MDSALSPLKRQRLLRTTCVLLYTKKRRGARAREADIRVQHDDWGSRREVNGRGNAKRYQAKKARG
jgi:hypothetical protein